MQIEKKNLKSSFEKNFKNINEKVFFRMNIISWNEIALFGMKLKYLQFKLIKRNFPGVSLLGMSLSIEKRAIWQPETSPNYLK